MKLNKLLLFLIPTILVICFIGCKGTYLMAVKIYKEDQNDIDKAEEYLISALEKEPQNSEIPFLLGSEIYSEKKEWQKMDEMFERSLKIDTIWVDQISNLRRRYSFELVSVEYQKTENINTTEAYQNFINKYPNSKLSKYAENKIISIEFNKTKEIDTIDAYKIFLEKHPNSKFTDEALDLITSIEIKQVFPDLKDSEKEYSQISDVINICDQIKSKKFELKKSEILSITKNLDEIAKRPIEFTKSLNWDTLTTTFENLKPLDSLLNKYVSEKKNLHLLISVKEIQFRLMSPLQIKSIRILKSGGFERTQKHLFSISNLNKEV